MTTKGPAPTATAKLPPRSGRLSTRCAQSHGELHYEQKNQPSFFLLHSDRGYGEASLTSFPLTIATSIHPQLICFLVCMWCRTRCTSSFQLCKNSGASFIEQL
ncbi:unnamed protein product [Sphagnum troendelagicum]|uniref:Uncharacterized protein n=1 Tax=Sphagnum troendelagicum TaxID=128251 RepID=A0ABP0TXW1_9BRYO